MLVLTKVHWRRGGARLVQGTLILAALGSSVLKPNLTRSEIFIIIVIQ